MKNQKVTMQNEMKVTFYDFKLKITLYKKDTKEFFVNSYLYKKYEDMSFTKNFDSYYKALNYYNTITKEENKINKDFYISFLIESSNYSEHTIS